MESASIITNAQGNTQNDKIYLSFASPAKTIPWMGHAKVLMALVVIGALFVAGLLYEEDGSLVGPLFIFAPILFVFGVGAVKFFSSRTVFIEGDSILIQYPRLSIKNIRKNLSDCTGYFTYKRELLAERFIIKTGRILYGNYGVVLRFKDGSLLDVRSYEPLPETFFDRMIKEGIGDYSDGGVRHSLIQSDFSKRIAKNAFKKDLSTITN